MVVEDRNHFTADKDTIPPISFSIFTSFSLFSDWFAPFPLKHSLFWAKKTETFAYWQCDVMVLYFHSTTCADECDNITHGTCYLSCQDFLHSIEAASSSQQSRIETLIAYINGVEFSTQFVQISWLHCSCGFHLFDVLDTVCTQLYSFTFIYVWI